MGKRAATCAVSLGRDEGGWEKGEAAGDFLPLVLRSHGTSGQPSRRIPVPVRLPGCVGCPRTKTEKPEPCGTGFSLKFLVFWTLSSYVTCGVGGGGGNRTPVRECSTPGVYRLRPKNNLASGRPFGRAASGQSVYCLELTPTDEGSRQPDGVWRSGPAYQASADGTLTVN